MDPQHQRIESKAKPIDPEFNLEDEQEALLVEAKALEPQPSISLNALPTRLYLEKAVLPTVYAALEALEKERPVNPIEFFSYYLITHNPYSTHHDSVQGSAGAATALGTQNELHSPVVSNVKL